MIVSKSIKKVSAFGFLVVSACGVDAAQISRLNKIEQEAIAQRAALESLQKRLEYAESQTFELRLKADATKFLELDLGQPDGYGRIDTNVGYFLIAVDDVKPYLDGQKITLRIGNPSQATYQGFVLKLAWGPRWDGRVNYDKWAESLKNRDLRFTDTLLPGAWNRVVVTLAPAQTMDLAYLSITMEVDRISLREPL